MSAHLELWVRRAPGENLDLMPLPSARVSMWETGLLDWGVSQEEASLESPIETPGPQEEALGQFVQAGCLPAQEAPEQEEQAEQAMRVQEPEEEQAHWKRQAPEQGQESRLGAEELRGLAQALWAQEKPGTLAQGLRELQGPEENGVDALPKGVPGAQEAQGLGDETTPAPGWREEAVAYAGHGLGAQRDYVKHDPSTLVPGVPLPSDLPPMASSPLTWAPGAGDVYPEALTPELAPPGQGHLPMSPTNPFPTEASPDEKASWEGPRKGSEQGLGAITVGSPPWTPASLCSVASLPGCPVEESLPAAGSLEASAASLSEVLKTPRAACHDPPSTDATWDLCPSTTGLSQPRPLASPLGPALPLRSNSFPGPHHTEPPKDLARSLSFSHWEPPKRPPKPATWGILTPQQGWRSGQDAGSILHSNGASPLLGKSLGLPPTESEGPGTAHSWPNEHSSAHTPHPLAVDGRVREPPSPLERRQGPVPTRQRHSHPAPAALCLRKGPPDHLTARQLRPLPATPDSPRAVQASLPPRARYNKPLPPTPNVPQHLPSAHSPRSLRTYKPLPPLPTLDTPTEPPPLPPKLRSRSRSTQGALASTPGQPTPGDPEWAAPPGPSAGRTSWPPATSQSVDPLVTASRSRGEVPLTLAFSNVTNLLSPLSPPTAAWPPEDRVRLTGEPGPQGRAPARREAQLLYQEYSDVFLNKEIQSQQRLDSLGEGPGQASPRQPRRALVSSESYLKRLSSASSGSLWQEIPVVRNSAVLLSMTHEDQKLQEAKFELIVSEASYLRSLHVAVDHFQLSTALRGTLSNQEHQWLFSRLQDVCDVSTTFLSDLEENFENNIFTFHVCDVVLSHAPHFRRVYLPYVTNQTYQERTFQSLLNSNSHFREVLEKLESDAVCQRLSLKSFLILPFQRITRLKLLLQAGGVGWAVAPHFPHEPALIPAPHLQLIRDCNSNAQRMRRTEELIYLSQRIAFECRIFPLISQSRWLVKSGELTALDFGMTPGPRRKLNTRPIHLHLFNDCLLLSRPREGGRFLVFDHAPFSEVRGEKCEMKLHGAHKNLFRLFLRHGSQGAQGPQAEFLFSTETQSEKLRWISALASPREELDLLECHDSPQVQCLRTYKARENDELALEKADVVMVTQQSSDGWLEGVRLSDGERGWFPLKQVDFIRSPEVRARNLQEAHRVKIARLQLVE
ncbi:rho guanine nucleotide exchange factor 5 [Echinops telfairi]|uniref:Rho guanine nucleotide exchange factor 5 n=1 Tax=Echinops telfairi TaxID=9371 RepID=A0ABM0ZT54_ECHTE|nr:rho guanine nucleotide exchange factor 5 [Echinops telfairi]